MSSLDILFLQEHWLTNSQFSLFNAVHVDFAYTAVSGINDSEILLGRPYGGCAIFWRSRINATISVLKTNSRRICAIQL
jgi:hypothetical protein